MIQFPGWKVLSQVRIRYWTWGLRFISSAEKSGELLRLRAETLHSNTQASFRRNRFWFLGNTSCRHSFPTCSLRWSLQYELSCRTWILVRSKSPDCEISPSGICHMPMIYDKWLRHAFTYQSPPMTSKIWIDIGLKGVETKLSRCAYSVRLWCSDRSKSLHILFVLDNRYEDGIRPLTSRYFVQRRQTH